MLLCTIARAATANMCPFDDVIRLTTVRLTLVLNIGRIIVCRKRVGGNSVFLIFIGGGGGYNRYNSIKTRNLLFSQLFYVIKKQLVLKKK